MCVFVVAQTHTHRHTHATTNTHTQTHTRTDTHTHRHTHTHFAGDGADHGQGDGCRAAHPHVSGENEGDVARRVDEAGASGDGLEAEKGTGLQILKNTHRAFT